MRLHIEVGLTAALLLAVGCTSDSNNEASPTAPVVTATELVSEPTRTQVPQPAPTPGPTEEPVARLRFDPADRNVPLPQTGSYILDMETLELWYLGRGGSLSPDSSAIARSYCCLGDGRGVDILEFPSGDIVNVPVSGDVTSATWSPDSQHLALIAVMPAVTQPTSERALYLVNRDGSGLRKVVNIDSERPWFDVTWLDEATILAVHDTLDFSAPAVRTFFRIDVAASSAEEVPTSNPPTQQDPRILTGERSRDGRWVAYEDGGLYVWDATNGGNAVLVDPEGRGPSWSYDSTRLLFVTLAEEGRSVIRHVFDTRTQAVTDYPDVGIWAYWLADGRIVHAGFRCERDELPDDVTVLDTATGGVEVLTQSPERGEFEAAVSPEGDRLVYVQSGSEVTSQSLELVDVATGARETLVVGPDDALHVHDSWSADGRYLRFTYGFAHGICD